MCSGWQPTWRALYRFCLHLGNGIVANIQSIRDLPNGRCAGSLRERPVDDVSLRLGKKIERQVRRRGQHGHKTSNSKFGLSYGKNPGRNSQPGSARESVEVLSSVQSKWRLMACELSESSHSERDNAVQLIHVRVRLEYHTLHRRYRLSLSEKAEGNVFMARYAQFRQHTTVHQVSNGPQWLW